MFFLVTTVINILARLQSVCTSCIVVVFLFVVFSSSTLSLGITVVLTLTVCNLTAMLPRPSHYYYYTRLTASSTTTWISQYQKGKTSLDLNGARDNGVLGWHWRQLDHLLIICTSVQTENYTDAYSVNFYRPDALPDAQPTVSKH